MKYNKFYNKEQEIRNFLLADVFGSILGMGLYTSVVNPLPEKMTQSDGNKELEKTLHFISKNFHEDEVVIKGSYTSCKAIVS
ncbi:hypothetical protein [Aquimarina algiphila]|uniref:hypothetical protein n=1 Tax=Aquimarina algiphila TaxID=2047982 RepID=UPI0024926E55|nr:hypothetical protein [Aquimarina algiphila]